jgi:hypothetical protein
MAEKKFPIVFKVAKKFSFFDTGGPRYSRFLYLQNRLYTNAKLVKKAKSNQNVSFYLQIQYSHTKSGTYLLE